MDGLEWLFFSLQRWLFLGLHFVLRDKPKIDWLFEKTGFPVHVGWVQPVADGPRTYVISGLNLGGENISGHGLHQFDGILFSPGTKKTLPLFVVWPAGSGFCLASLIQ